MSSSGRSIASVGKRDRVITSKEKQVAEESRYFAGARAGLPFALATLVLGISFGVLARSLGWGMLTPIIFSVIAASGSAQFGVAAVLGAGGGPIAAIGARSPSSIPARRRRSARWTRPRIGACVRSWLGSA